CGSGSAQHVRDVDAGRAKTLDELDATVIAADASDHRHAAAEPPGGHSLICAFAAAERPVVERAHGRAGGGESLDPKHEVEVQRAGDEDRHVISPRPPRA